MKPVKHYSIDKISLSNASEYSVASKSRTDYIVVEEPLEVWFCYHINHAPPAELLYTTMRTPGDDINLVLGWLFCSGIIQNLSDVYSINHTGTGRLKRHTTNRIMVTFSKRVDVSQFKRADVANSACGVCGEQSIEKLLEKLPKKANSATKQNSITVQSVSKLVSGLGERQSIFEQTGGNHGVALFDYQAHILDVREDVGRHNALDKLIGANLSMITKSNHNLAGVVLSGRVGFEMVQKAAMAGLHYIIALGAPSSLAIDLAEDCDICLFGFMKPEHCNLYTGAHLLSDNPTHQGV
ncbi:formate dehydrogenase accessory sulfurtransferase FdhD [uncultured Paraglaciecola sp.]|uniref:formate dehydrogenase accessory sulfurtransferase FdhD n=1 Tax=uncultured Paraglaciecola sp. TaxID=1765024 RepID=UPI00259A184B|nr:formate dehydrogenase accessory sulfurtransferase FdhD [uncultured Paraglaciecola sp.]